MSNDPTQRASFVTMEATNAVREACGRIRLESAGSSDPDQVERLAQAHESLAKAEALCRNAERLLLNVAAVQD